MTSLIKTSIHTLNQKEKIDFEEKTEDGYPKSNIANFINCYISHLFFARNFTFNLDHYFNIFYFIVKINPQAAYYVLNKQIIARFYLFLFDKCSDKQTTELIEEQIKLKDMSDCPYKKISAEEIKTGGFKSHYYQKKRSKNEANYSISHMNLEYFWKTIADLIKYCCANEENCNPNETTPHKLTNLEISYLKNDKQKVFVSIWETADSLKVAKAIAKVYAFAAKEDLGYSSFLSKMYTTKIFAINNETTIKYMLKGFWYFLNIEDSFSKTRVFFKLFRTSARYFQYF